MEELGPTFIKLGQTLSVRPTWFPWTFAMNSVNSRTEFLPFGYEDVKKQIKESFGSYPDKIFASFDSVPFAAASLRSGASCTTQDGRKCRSKKVQRPDMRKMIETDIDILYTLAQLLIDICTISRSLTLSALLMSFPGYYKGDRFYL